MQVKIQNLQRLASHSAWIVAAAFFLTGCASSSSDDDVANLQNVRAKQEAPVNYVPQIIEFMKTYLNDPTGVRAAQISAPSLMTVEGYDRYAVCLRYNARDLGGTYSGVSERLVIFTNGRLDRFLERAKDRCGSAQYRPFPELEQLTRR